MLKALPKRWTGPICAAMFLLPPMPAPAGPPVGAALPAAKALPRGEVRIVAADGFARSQSGGSALLFEGASLRTSRAETVVLPRAGGRFALGQEALLSAGPDDSFRLESGAALFWLEAGDRTVLSARGWRVELPGLDHPEIAGLLALTPDGMLAARAYDLPFALLAGERREEVPAGRTVRLPAVEPGAAIVAVQQPPVDDDDYFEVPPEEDDDDDELGAIFGGDGKEGLFAAGGTASAAVGGVAVVGGGIVVGGGVITPADPPPTEEPPRDPVSGGG